MKAIILLIPFIFIFQKTTAQVSKSIPFSSQEYFKEQKKYALKTSITSPLLGNFSFSVEHAIHPRKTLEARFSLVNSNKLSEESLDGFYLGFGYKKYLSRLHSNKKGRTVSIFQGFYIQPELLLGFTNKNVVATTFLVIGSRGGIPIEKQKINYQILLLNFGMQNTLLESLIIDIYAGFGIGRDNILGGDGRFFLPQNSAVYHPGILKSNTGFSMAGKVGVRLGILL